MSSESEASQEKNRNFICSCGKAYLSYAALFTHIKQKHGGKAPGEIIRPRSQNKRGRPRKSQKLISDKSIKSLSNIDFLVNNNQKNNNFINESNLDDNISRISQSNGNGFRSYKYERQQIRSKSNKLLSNQFYRKNNINEFLQMQLQQFEQSNLQFANPNNELSKNTLTLASIIIALQQLFKSAEKVEQVHIQDLQKFSCYQDLKKFHSEKLLENKCLSSNESIFLLGNVVCAFLGFCQQTIVQKKAYQQIVLLIVCLLEHIKNKKKINILKECDKQVIHDTLSSFFTQYLDKFIIKYKLNFWIFKQNNSFNVIIWFLNWISTIQNNFEKTEQNQKNSQLKFNQVEYQQIGILEIKRQLSKTHNPDQKKQILCLNELRNQVSSPQNQSQFQQNEINCQFQNFVQQFNEDIVNQNYNNLQKKNQQEQIQNQSVKNQSQIRPLLQA